MAKRTCIVAGVLILAVLALPLAAQQSEADRATNNAKTATRPTNYEQWSNGPASDPGFFPIAVWVQAPKNAKVLSKPVHLRELVNEVNKMLAA